MLLGALSAPLLIVPTRQVVRKDGTSPGDAADQKQSTACQELREVVKVPTDRFMLLLTPLIFSSNWFYTYVSGPHTYSAL